MRVRQAVMVLALTLAGCEAITGLKGLVGAVTEVGKHLEGDLKAELTDAKINKVVEVAPKLQEFSKTATVKWEIDPDAPDFSQLASALGGLSDYIAFFEGEDTRITEFYVDLVKIQDARGQVAMRKAHDEAKGKLETEQKELEARLAAASDEAKASLEQELARNATARQQLDELHAAQQKARAERQTATDGGYALSDTEIARIEARLPEIEAAFTGAGIGVPKTET